MDSYTDRWEEYLFLTMARLLHWPAIANRWLYPQILRWDRDEEGRLVVPAAVVFTYNPTQPFTLEDRRRFQLQLRVIVPGPWHFDYDSPLAIICERRPNPIYVHHSEREVQIIHRPTHESLPIAGILRRLMGNESRARASVSTSTIRRYRMRLLRRKVRELERLSQSSEQARSGEINAVLPADHRRSIGGDNRPALNPGGEEVEGG